MPPPPPPPPKRRHAPGLDFHVLGGKCGELFEAVEYDGGRNAVAAILLLPDDDGALGPGVLRAHRASGLDARGKPLAYGSLFARLGVELSSGEDVEDGPGGGGWQPPSRGVGLAVKKTSRGTPKRPRATVLHLSWRAPSEADTDVTKLQAAVDVVLAAAEHARESTAGGQPPKKVILVGFGFGSAVAFAAAKALGPDVVAGVASLCGAARGGKRFRDAGTDTETCVLACTNVPKLWAHGTKDETVSPAVSRHFWELADGAKCLLWVKGMTHAVDVARVAMYAPVKEWLAQVVKTRAMASTGWSSGPFGSDQTVSAIHRTTRLTNGAHVAVVPMRVSPRSEHVVGRGRWIQGTNKVACGLRREVGRGGERAHGALAKAHAKPFFFYGGGEEAMKHSRPLGGAAPPGLGLGWLDVSSDEDGALHSEIAADEVNDALVKYASLARLAEAGSGMKGVGRYAGTRGYSE